MAVVVTVPHGFCPRPCDEGRQCDCVAAHWARVLAATLKARGVTVKLLIPTTPRFKGDYNRFWTRETSYRKLLTAALETAWLVLDIHSFPPPHWAGYNAIILDDRRPPPQSALQFSAATGIALDSNGASNDIQDEAHQAGKEAFLIEFNEKGDPAVQTAYISAIADWVFNNNHGTR